MIRSIRALQATRMTGKHHMIIVRVGLLVPQEEVEDVDTVVARIPTKVVNNPRLTTTSKMVAS